VRAREEAERCRRLVAAGVDPIHARNEERETARIKAAKAMTFEQCATSFIASHELGWRGGRTSAHLTSALKTYALPTLGTLPVQAIDTALVLKVLEPIWAEKSPTASRLRASIENVLSWAKARGYRSGENPTAWRGHLDQLLAAPSKVRRVQHHQALAFAEVPAFMETLRSRNGIAPRALEFTILTVSRIGQALGRRWDEIDLEAKL
jgi:integrase